MLIGDENAVALTVDGDAVRSATDGDLPCDGLRGAVDRRHLATPDGGDEEAIIEAVER